MTMNKTRSLLSCAYFPPGDRNGVCGRCQIMICAMKKHMYQAKSKERVEWVGAHMCTLELGSHWITCQSQGRPLWEGGTWEARRIRRMNHKGGVSGTIHLHPAPTTKVHRRLLVGLNTAKAPPATEPTFHECFTTAFC